MSAYPATPRSAFFSWCQAHSTVWAANQAGIGLSIPQCTAYTALVTAAAAALENQELAKQAAIAATAACDNAFAALRSGTSDTLKTIRLYAIGQDKPETVYTLAQIPAPATPSPAPPPAKPTDLVAVLAPGSGELTLRWKAANPPGTSGTAYIIRRKLAGETSFSVVGTIGKKSFTDTTLLAGPDSVQYTIQGQRGNSMGPVSDLFTVNFGRTGGDGSLQAFVTTGGSSALAA